MIGREADQMRPRKRLEDLLERSKAAREGDERVGQLVVHRFAFVHRVYDAELHARIRAGDDLLPSRKRGIHADDLAARCNAPRATAPMRPTWPPP